MAEAPRWLTGKQKGWTVEEGLSSEARTATLVGPPPAVNGTEGPGRGTRPWHATQPRREGALDSAQAQ